MNPYPGCALAALRHTDAERIGEVFPAGRRAEILAAILAGGGAGVQPSPWPRLRARIASARRSARPLPAGIVAFGALAAAAAAVVVLVLPGHHASSSVAPLQASPVSFRYPTRGSDRGYIVATVTDPFAAQSSLNAAFRAAGLDISVALVAASPSAVGTVVEISEPSNGPQIETLTGGSCVTGGGGPGGCPVGLKIPRDFSGAGSVTLGRPAKPGEAYESTNSAFAPGESLHCSALIGKTVAAAKPELAAREITVQWRPSTPASFSPAAPTATNTTATNTTATNTTATNTTATNTTATSTSETDATTSTASGAGAGVLGGTGLAGLAQQYVVDGIPISAGVVMIQTQVQPPAPNQLAQDAQMYGAGC